MVGIGGLEPPTSSLSETRSNQLSYMPIQKLQKKSVSGTLYTKMRWKFKGFLKFFCWLHYLNIISLICWVNPTLASCSLTKARICCFSLNIAILMCCCVVLRKSLLNLVYPSNNKGLSVYQKYCLTAPRARTPIMFLSRCFFVITWRILSLRRNMEDIHLVNIHYI